MNDKIEKAIKPIIKMYSDIETELLIIIARHFKNNEEFYNSDYWRIKKLEEMGVFNEEVVKYISEYANKPLNEVKKALNNIAIDTISQDKVDELFKENKITINSDILKNNYTIKNMINYAYDELSNQLIQMSNKIEKSTRKAYLNVVESAYLKTSMGTHSYSESIREAINDLSNKGITVLTYKTVDEDGNVVGIRNYDIEGAVRREVLTAARQLSGDISIEIANQLECEYVYLSEHLCCRPSHFDWQGTIIKRKDLEKVTHYGEVDGLYGINCAHYVEPYFGDAKGNELKKLSNEECKNAYNLSQHQRYLERGIRSWKHKEEMFKVTGDEGAYIKSHNKRLEWQKRIQEFTNENNLRRNFTNEYVNQNKLLFSDNIIEKDFEKLNNDVEHMIIYDVNSGNKKLQITNNSKNSVGGLKAFKTILTSKNNSLVVVHNHPSNSSFSFRDIETFNNYKSINSIVVKTEKYLYYLEKNDINKVKSSVLKDVNAKIRKNYFRKYGKNTEVLHLINKKIAKEMGWNYGRIERK